MATLFEAYVTNAGKYADYGVQVGEPLKFPTTTEEVQALLKWFGADGGYSFISALAEDNELAVRSLTALEEKLRGRDLHPLFITGHTGWTDNMDFAFAHKNELCSPFRRKAHDPNAPYDAYDESDDTEERAKSRYLAGVGR